MARTLDMSAMENCVCFNLRWVTRAITQSFDAELRRHGLRPTQTPILAALAAKPGWSMQELSDWLGMDRTTLIRNLHPLKRDGLVELSGTGRGGHVTISITTQGKKDLHQAMPAWRAAQKAVVETLGDQRWSSILTDLDRAVRALKE